MPPQDRLIYHATGFIHTAAVRAVAKLGIPDAIVHLQEQAQRQVRREMYYIGPEQDSLTDTPCTTILYKVAFLSTFLHTVSRTSYLTHFLLFFHLSVSRLS